MAYDQCFFLNKCLMRAIQITCFASRRPCASSNTVLQAEILGETKSDESSSSDKFQTQSFNKILYSGITMVFQAQRDIKLMTCTVPYISKMLLDLDIVDSFLGKIQQVVRRVSSQISSFEMETH